MAARDGPVEIIRALVKQGADLAQHSAEGCASKQGNSNKASKHTNRRKANPIELDTGSKGHDEPPSGRRDSGDERDDMARDAARIRKPNGEIDAQGGENTAGLVFDSGGLSHNKPEGSIGRDVQRVEASSVECEAGTTHSRVEQPTITQAERHRQKERERQRKRNNANGNGNGQRQRKQRQRQRNSNGTATERQRLKSDADGNNNI
jgi:hypothetical protein